VLVGRRLQMCERRHVLQLADVDRRKQLGHKAHCPLHTSCHKCVNYVLVGAPSHWPLRYVTLLTLYMPVRSNAGGRECDKRPTETKNDKNTNKLKQKPMSIKISENSRVIGDGRRTYRLRPVYRIGRILWNVGRLDVRHQAAGRSQEDDVGTAASMTQTNACSLVSVKLVPTNEICYWHCWRAILLWYTSASADAYRQTRGGGCSPSPLFKGNFYLAYRKLLKLTTASNGHCVWQNRDR